MTPEEFEAYMTKKRVLETPVTNSIYSKQTTPSEILDDILTNHNIQHLDDLNALQKFMNEIKGIEDNHVHDWKNTFGFIFECRCGKSVMKMPNGEYRKYVEGSSVVNY